VSGVPALRHHKVGRGQSDDSLYIEALGRPRYGEGDRRRAGGEGATLMPVAVHKPQGIYQKVRGRAPDMIAYFEDLAWRSMGSVGLNGLYTMENDTGPGDANRAPFGLMIFHDPQAPKGGQVLEGAQLYDIVPTVLDRYDIPAPKGLRGKVLPI
jgi:predicted AlkP superfamily phosphohydrolase/phosphomutase